MKIQLNEITEEGKTFSFPTGHAELTAQLRDLVGNRACSAEISIRKASAQSFEMRGWIRAQVPEQCSRCAEDFDQPIDEVFREILVPAQELPRDGKNAKVNHVSDLEQEGPSVIEYESDQFDLGEYLHEVVALASPDYPAPPIDAGGNCALCHIGVTGKSFSYDEDFEKVESPFSVLKNLKLN